MGGHDFLQRSFSPLRLPPCWKDNAHLFVFGAFRYEQPYEAVMSRRWTTIIAESGSSCPRNVCRSYTISRTIGPSFAKPSRAVMCQQSMQSYRQYSACWLEGFLLCEAEAGRSVLPQVASDEAAVAPHHRAFRRQWLCQSFGARRSSTCCSGHLGTSTTREMLAGSASGGGRSPDSDPVPVVEGSGPKGHVVARKPMPRWRLSKCAHDLAA